jgi:hypothetical protein
MSRDHSQPGFLQRPATGDRSNRTYSQLLQTPTDTAGHPPLLRATTHGFFSPSAADAHHDFRIPPHPELGRSLSLLATNPIEKWLYQIMLFYGLIYSAQIESDLTQRQSIIKTLVRVISDGGYHLSREEKNTIASQCLSLLPAIETPTESSAPAAKRARSTPSQPDFSTLTIAAERILTALNESDQPHFLLSPAAAMDMRELMKGNLERHSDQERTEFNAIVQQLSQSLHNDQASRSARAKHSTASSGGASSGAPAMPHGGGSSSAASSTAQNTHTPSLNAH